MGPLLQPKPDSHKGNGIEARRNTAVQESATSDELLLVAVGNTQNVGAFNQLFTRFSARVFALGMKLTRNDQLALDLVQEVMLAVWQKASMFDCNRGNAQSWIFTLTRNRCFDMLRKQKRFPVTVSADDIWPVDVSTDSALVYMEKGALEVQIAQIEGFCDSLPKSQQAVIEQIYIHDRTHEEAAAVLDIPLGTLKSRLRLGVSKLRAKIGNEL